MTNEEVLNRIEEKEKKKIKSKRKEKDELDQDFIKNDFYWKGKTDK